MCDVVAAAERDEAIPAYELAFRWYGGRVSVCFTATLGERWRRSIERLRSPKDLARWFHESGLTDGEPVVTAAHLRTARLLREALYRTFTAWRLGRSPSRTDVELVNRWATRPVAGPALALARGRARLEPTVRDVPGLLATIAADAVDLLCGPFADRIRECERDDCALLFVDESRSGRRRWCSMDACGAKTKMSAYRRRQRASGVDS
jgi:predicted RNA-binding Zn ribbon-like protein